jgi:hypothetical protein
MGTKKACGTRSNKVSVDPARDRIALWQLPEMLAESVVSWFPLSVASFFGFGSWFLPVLFLRCPGSFGIVGFRFLVSFGFGLFDGLVPWGSLGFVVWFPWGLVCSMAWFLGVLWVLFSGFRVALLPFEMVFPGFLGCFLFGLQVPCVLFLIRVLVPWGYLSSVSWFPWVLVWGHFYLGLLWMPLGN